ncbi:MAG: hypothetical protein GYA21_16120 [Myxococcales bacterium]|nr:hypothetical protein [Myxococcales bacterium]
MDRLRRLFTRHWFAGVFVIIGIVWLLTTIAYFSGAQSITFPNRYGKRPTIDFSRKYDFPVVDLGRDVGLMIDNGGQQLQGSILKLKEGVPILCWLCGERRNAGHIGRAAFRKDDWFFRAPRDESRNTEARRGRPESRDFILTIAYNRATGERLRVEVDQSVEEQARLLADKGLFATEDTMLTQESLADLPPVSMLREGCAVVQLAFAACSILWFVLGGLMWSLVKVFKRRRESQKAT